MTGPSTAPDFEIVGELGRTGEGAAYLARDRSTNELVALRDPADGGRPIVTRALNSAIPSSARACPICRTAIMDWRRYCGQCGTDLSGVDVAPEGLDDREVVESVLRSVQNPVDLLGSMRRSEGGGAVWFGRDRKTGEVMALDLTRKGSGSDFDVAVTATLTAFHAGSQAAPDVREPAESGPSSAEPRTPPPVGTSPPPDAERAEGASDGPARVCPSCGKEYASDLRFCPDDGSALRARQPQDTLVGEVIASRYQITRRIGRGGMGQVYQARHVRMGRMCAIKVLNRELTNDVSAIGRFSREATNASRINHVNVAHIYDFGETPEHGVYLAMEYVEGQPLSKIIAAEAPLANERVIAIAEQVADALAAAHEEGVVHRDLTPNNVMIATAHDGSDLVKVVDFGIAKATQDMNARLTQTGVVIGTPQYMSPEQLLAEPVDGRSDIYSMGCVLFEMLTGSPPFGGATALNQFARRLTEAPPAPAELNAEVWPALSDIVLRMLARRRDDRFESAVALRHALRDVAEPAAEPSAPPVEPPAESWIARKLRRLRDSERAFRGSARTGETGRAGSGERAGGAEDATRRMPMTGPAAGPSRAATGAGADPADSGGAAGSETEPPAGPAVAGPPAMGSGPAPSDAAELAATRLSPGRAESQPARAAAGAASGTGPADGTLVMGADGVEAPPPPTRRRPVSARWVAVFVVAAGAVGTWLVTRGDAPPATGAPPAVNDAATGQEPDPPVAPLPGTVRLGVALPPGAIVRANGNRVTVDGDRILLPAGDYRLEIEAAGFEPVVDQIRLDAAEELRWSPDLRRVAAAAPPPSAEQPGPTQRDPDPPPVTSAARPGAASVTPPAGARPDSGVAAVTGPVTFADVSRARIESFRSSVEAGDLTAIRAMLKQSEVQAFGDIFQRAGSRPLRVSVRALVPDSTGLRTTFLLRIDVAGNGENLLMWTDFVAGFQRRGDSWQLITVDRS